jgi:hypothetical protein
LEVVNAPVPVTVIEKDAVPEAPVNVTVAWLFSTLPSGEASDPVLGVR